MKAEKNNKIANTLARLTCLAALALGTALPVHAGPFEIAVSPSRFEISGNSGQRVGQSFDIHNVGTAATEVMLRTLDWSYTPDGKITYYDELRPDSCRPWVTLERNTLKIAAKSKQAFRFQVEVPKDAPRGECRFMLAVEGVEPAHRSIIESHGASLSLPVSGRIAIAVYMAVNGAEPRLQMTKVEVKAIQGKRTPAVTITNSGDAHGRLDGALEAVDAQGLAFELVPENTPILPGQTRLLPLSPKSVDNQKAPEVTFPFKAHGTVDWEKGSFKVNAEFR